MVVGNRVVDGCDRLIARRVERVGSEGNFLSKEKMYNI